MHIHISPLRKTISSFPSEKNPSVPITVRLHTAELTQPPEDPRAPYAPTCPRRSSARSPALRQPSLSPAARSGRAPALPGSRLPPPLPRVVSTAPPRGSARRSAGYPRPATAASGAATCQGCAGGSARHRSARLRSPPSRPRAAGRERRRPPRARGGLTSAGAPQRAGRREGRAPPVRRAAVPAEPALPLIPARPCEAEAQRCVQPGLPALRKTARPWSVLREAVTL